MVGGGLKIVGMVGIVDCLNDFPVKNRPEKVSVENSKTRQLNQSRKQEVR